MPPKRNKKKKTKTRERNQKAISCNGCSQPLDRKDFQECPCTKVRYCSSACLQEHPHVDCPGPPETRINMDEQLRRFRNSGERLQSNQDEELFQTVLKPHALYLQQIMGRPASSYLTAEQCAELADATDMDVYYRQAFAFLAGSGYRHRILGTAKVRARGRGGRDRMYVENSKTKELAVIESEERAFYYFKKAAKWGHGLAMQSLGTCYDDGVGCQRNRRYCNQWLWRSCLLQSSGASELLECRALLPIETNANGEMMDNAKDRILEHPGIGMKLSGPNLASLLLAFLPVLEKENYSLPPFAGVVPTATVGRREASEILPHRVPLIGAAAIQKLKKKAIKFESKGHPITFCYGRRGVAKGATAQTRGEVPRCLDCQLFIVPPAPACDETVSQSDIQSWVTQVHHQQYEYSFRPSESRMEPLKTECIHSESSGEKKPRLYCEECIQDADDRLWAVSTGAVVLSVNESLPQHGQAVIFRGRDGLLKMETWKNYSQGEAECVLAILAAADEDVYTAPLFIAQDPNLFWPLVFHHGCIRAALEFVAPHCDWGQRLGTIRETLGQSPIVADTVPRDHLLKCGNDHCTALIPEKSALFMDCTGCYRRRYCSSECQDVDWKIHVAECEAAAVGSSRKPKLAVPPSPNQGLSNAAEKRALKRGKNTPRKGEEVVIHSLKSQPQYNEAIGVVGEKANEERYAVTLMTGQRKTISIKADNLYTIDVFCRKRKKKSRVFECYEHALEVCSDCYFDFTLCNSLARLQLAGNDITNLATINQISDSHYSAISHSEEEEQSHQLDKEWPWECHGMGSHPRERFVFKSLLQTKADLSLSARVAKAALISFGARTFVILRQPLNPQLQSVATALMKKSQESSTDKPN